MTCRHGCTLTFFVVALTLASLIAVHAQPATEFYRGKTIFAAVPKTKALGSPNSVIFKLPKESKWRDEAAKDARIQSESMETHKWLQFEIRKESDLRDALVWFERAFQSAKPPRK